MDSKPLKNFEYTAVVWKESEGYVSKCSELGVASYGDSYDHAVSNLREAVELYLENAKALDLLEDIEERLTTKEKFTTRIEAAVP
jgi:predicted RNase H-like HicB family nuclease